MAISINPATLVIFVPQSYLTPVSGDLYELDVNQFRLDLKDLEDDPDGMTLLDTHRHNTEVTLAGATFARTVEIINGYKVEFEDGLYTVRCVGANHNIGDVKVVNSVSLIVGNSAGLISVSTADLADQVWAKILEPGFDASRILRIIAAVLAGKSTGGPGTPVFRNLGDTQDQVSGTANTSGDRSSVTHGS